MNQESSSSSIRIALFLERLDALQPRDLLWIKELRTDSKVYRAARLAVEEAIKRDPNGLPDLIEAQRRARDIVKAKEAASGWSLTSAVNAAEDAVAGMYLRYLPGELTARLYRPFDPVIPSLDLYHKAWEQANPEQAAKQKVLAEAIAVEAKNAQERKRREAPIHWGTVISFMGEDIVALGIGIVLGFAVNWQVGAMLGAVCFLALTWGTGPTHAYDRIHRYRDLKRVDAKTRSVIETLDGIIHPLGTLTAVGLLIVVAFTLCGSRNS